jgi:hypothetical protein
MAFQYNAQLAFTQPGNILHLTEAQLADILNPCIVRAFSARENLMLPFGHIAYTWAALSLLQSHHRAMNLDYRGAAVAALLPDIIDKPLSLTLLSESGTSQGLSHTLVGHAFVTVATARLKPTWLPYALVFNSHLVADQMWKYRNTLFFPFLGRLASWRYMGSPAAMLSAYAEIALRPSIVAVEAVGLALLGWVAKKHRLHHRRPLSRFLLTGKTNHEALEPPSSLHSDRTSRVRRCTRAGPP